MQVCRTTEEAKRLARERRVEGRTRALVPTMGALHEGHRSLVHHAIFHADEVWVSLFVNPLQFGPNEDFERYPRSFEDDCAMCREEGVAVLFAPDAGEMYAPDRSVFVDEDRLSRALCGASRPGHFRGVCTVVAKLFNLVQPDLAVFGEKDAQQVRVIERMVRDLDMPVRIARVETAREHDGLAISSRNVYLSHAEREQAALIRRGLHQVEWMFDKGERDVAVLRARLLSWLEKASLGRLDYADFVDDETLEPMTVVDRPCLVAVAMFFGRTRLIDNVTLGC